MKELRDASLEFGDWRARDFEDERLERRQATGEMNRLRWEIMNDVRDYEWCEKREVRDELLIEVGVESWELSN